LWGAAADDDACPSDPFCGSGSAYMFRWNGSRWVQEQKLLPSDGAEGDLFGWSVSVSGDVAVVGAFGTAYVFRWNGSTWQEEQRLLASDGAEGDGFGSSVSVSGDVAIVSAYMFRWNGSTWAEEQKLFAWDRAESNWVAAPATVSGDVAVVGALGGYDGNGLRRSGAAYVFRWNGSEWAGEQKLLASDGATNEFFGGSVSVSGDVAVVGAAVRYDENDDSTSEETVPGEAWVAALDGGAISNDDSDDGSGIVDGPGGGGAGGVGGTCGAVGILFLPSTLLGLMTLRTRRVRHDHANRGSSFAIPGAEKKQAPWAS